MLTARFVVIGLAQLCGLLGACSSYIVKLIFSGACICTLICFPDPWKTECSSEELETNFCDGSSLPHLTISWRYHWLLIGYGEVGGWMVVIFYLEWLAFLGRSVSKWIQAPSNTRMCLLHTVVCFIWPHICFRNYIQHYLKPLIRQPIKSDDSFSQMLPNHFLFSLVTYL